jgi:uncharacterized protein YecT (DUF1311 family)
MQDHPLKWTWFILLRQCAIHLVWLSSLITYPVFALDHPDAPNLLKAFETREQIYKRNAQNPHNTIQDKIQAYALYETFLTNELKKAYQYLLTRLDSAKKHALQQAQYHWAAYRDAELAMIQQTWTRAQFGSSFVLSRGDYRTNLIRTRIVQLLHYAKNYL